MIDVRIIKNQVAETVMGLDVCKCERPRFAFGHGEFCFECQKSPALFYSTDIAAAWKVVEKFGHVVLSGPESVSNQWLATFDAKRESVWGDSAPLAICLAALKAVEK